MSNQKTSQPKPQQPPTTSKVPTKTIAERAIVFDHAETESGNKQSK